MAPNFLMEQKLISEGHSIVAGVDEVGRGPLAGPVTAAAVILDPLNIPNNLNDSKVLSLKKREELYEKSKYTLQTYEWKSLIFSSTVSNT